MTGSLGTLRAHQLKGLHATPANTPTLWGGSSSSTKFPNESWRPPTPSFPPYDVRTPHFVECGRPWLLHCRMDALTCCGNIFWTLAEYTTFPTFETLDTCTEFCEDVSGGSPPVERKQYLPEPFCEDVSGGSPPAWGGPHGRPGRQRFIKDFN